jgi:carbon-monoxide dehydrogenase large subunit
MTIGARVPRAEDGRLLTGRGWYVGDIDLPRMLHAAFIRSDRPHARIVRVDTERARRGPGVVTVLVSSDLPQAELVSAARHPKLLPTPQPVLAVDRVRFVGEAVGVVIAEDRYVAEDALECVTVDYDDLPVVTEAAPWRSGSEPIAPTAPADRVFEEEAKFGDPDTAFASAAYVFSKTFESRRCVASPLETRGCVADYEPTSQRLTVWCSTQSPHRLRRKLALATGLPEHRVVVMIHDVGGAFGQKIPVQPEEIVVALAAIRLGRPVKWIEDRRENLMAAPHARGQTISLDLAVARDGKFLGLRARIEGDAGAYSFNSGSALTEPYLAARMLPGPYRIADYRYHCVAFLTNKVPVAPYRGVGMVAAQVARELLIDEAARHLQRDRMALRRQNLVRAEDFPYHACTGPVFDHATFQESLETALAMVGYEAFLVEQERAVQEGRLLGLGVSVYVEPTAPGTELVEQVYGVPGMENDSARVSMDPSGTVTVSCGLTSQGQGIETTMAQVAADVLGVPLEDVVVSWSDTSSTPLSLTGTRGSRAAVVAGGAVGLAAQDVRERILRVAARLLEARPDDLTVTLGQIHVKGYPGASVSVKEAVRAGFERTELREVAFEPNFTSTRFYDPGAAYGNGCIAVVVEVDPDTGAVVVRRIVGVEDCGTVINPTIVEGQMAGGIVQGLGSALLETAAYDDGGQLLTTTFLNYLLPTTTETVNIELAHLASRSPRTWGGIKGVGEAGSIGAPAAIAAAVADALRPFGARVTAIPLLPEVVLRLMRPDL